MPTNGLALPFDPRYLEFVIHAWNQKKWVPLPLNDLKTLAATEAEHQFERLNAMGLLEEDVAPEKIDKALSVLKSLKMASEAKIGPKEAKITTVMPTSQGKVLLDHSPICGGFRPDLVHTLVRNSPELQSLIAQLDAAGPLTLPLYQPQPNAPKKKSALQEAMHEGLHQFWDQVGVQPGESSTGAGTPASQVKKAYTAALAHHPAGAIKSVDKALAVADLLGIIWTNSTILSPVVTMQSIGTAMLRTQENDYIPNIPEWSSFAARFVSHLVTAYNHVADSSGFATIVALRGALGQSLQLAAPVVDDFIGRARDAGDAHELPVRIHFEEDEELLYRKERKPLIWHDHAFDFVEVVAIPQEQNGRIPTGAMFRGI